MFNYKLWREGKEGRKQSGEEVSEKVRERTVTQIAEETFCLKSDLAVKRLRIAQKGRPFCLSLSYTDLSERKRIAFKFRFERAVSREQKTHFHTD